MSDSPKIGPEPTFPPVTGAMTMNEWDIECNEVMTLNGFNDTAGRYLNGLDPVAQIAALSTIKLRFTDLAEAVRKPWRKKSGGMKFGKALRLLIGEIIVLWWLGLPAYTERYLRKIDEWGKPVHGSVAQVVHRFVLVDTETSEAIQGIEKGDIANVAEEITDARYRLNNLVGHWNQTHPDKFINSNDWMHYKHGINLERGLMHGGKRA